MKDKAILIETFNEMINKMLTKVSGDASKKQMLNREVEKIEEMKETLSFNDINNMHKGNIEFYDLYIKCLILKKEKLNNKNSIYEK